MVGGLGFGCGFWGYGVEESVGDGVVVGFGVVAGGVSMVVGCVWVVSLVVEEKLYEVAVFLFGGVG